jgi:predicted DNA-binding WGR domain protein
MAQPGQVFPLAGQGKDGTRWAYRYRVGGRGSRRVQRGGFASEQAATEALERELEQLRRERGLVESPTLAEFVVVYLAQQRRPRSHRPSPSRRRGSRSHPKR